MIKKLIGVFAVNLIFISISFCQSRLPETISDQSEIYVITCGPGNEIWSHFGHTAIEVVDPQTGMDITFNYGMFDYSDPDFVWKFARRNIYYFLAVNYTDEFVRSYQAGGRSVYRQKLRISSEQAKKVYDYLKADYENENRRFYLYEFFFDNCATRPRDVIEATCLPDGAVDWDKHPDAGKYTFREIIDPGFAATPWVDFGIDLVLGSPVDRKATNGELMFNPLYLTEILAETQADGHKLAGEIEYLYEGDFEEPEPFWLTPEIAFWALFALVVFQNVRPYRRWMRFTDSFLFLIFGSLGVFLLFMWFGTLHPGTKDNFNLIWASPLHLISIPFLFSSALRNRVPYYFIFMAGLMFAFMLTFWIMPQDFHPASKPIVLILGMRYYKYHRLQVNKVALG